MSKEQTSELLMVKGMISELPIDQQEACKELAEFIRMNLRTAGPVVGGLAMAQVGMEAQQGLIWK